MYAQVVNERRQPQQVLGYAVHLAPAPARDALGAQPGPLQRASAALVCGAVWGGLYYRFKSPLLNVVSHTAWDVAVFLLFPFT